MKNTLSAETREKLEALFQIAIEGNMRDAVLAAQTAYRLLNSHGLSFTDLLCPADAVAPVPDFARMFGVTNTAASLKADIASLEQAIEFSKVGRDQAEREVENLRQQVRDIDRDIRNMKRRKRD